MFLRSLQWRLVAIFQLLVLSIMMVVSVVLLANVESYYYKNFTQTVKTGVELSGITSMTRMTSKELIRLLNEEALTWFDIYGARENWMLVDMAWKVVNAEGESKKTLELSKNLINAASGAESYNKNSMRDGSFDYARPIHLADGTYILYIKYPKSNWGGTLTSLKWIIFISTVIAMVATFFLGYALSNTITIPIRNLTRKAKKVAAGDFDQIIKTRSSDEIGQLTNSFNHMTRELKSTLNQISNEKIKMETILQYMTDGVIAFSPHGMVIHANPAAIDMLELNSENHGFDTVFSSLGIDITMQTVLNSEPDALIERSIESNGKFLKVFFVPFDDWTMKARGVIAVVQNVTEQHRLDLMRKEFVANVSHELRTPITTIKSYTETLLEEPDNPDLSVKFLNVINSESDRMTRLVKDLLQLSKIEYEQGNWNKEVFDLAELTQDVVDKERLKAESKKQTLEASYQKGSAKIFADRDRIEQVILNILSNAIKYTGEGGHIKISVNCTGQQVELVVQDNGIGIPKEDLPRIFERFYRVDKARSRELGGTGLGLSIAKEIVEAHDGEIFIDSDKDKGTQVKLQFPICNSNLNML